MQHTPRSMLQKLLAALESANFNTAVRQGRLTCPACGSGPAQTITPAKDDVITCANCGTAASALEWASRTSAAQLIGNADEPPDSTRITRQLHHSGSISWNIPASGRSGGLMFFAIFWCGLTAVLTGAAMFGQVRGSGNLSSASLLVLFFGFFWATGIGVAYAACRSKYAKHRLTIDPSNITLRRELFGRSTENTLPTASVQSISAVEFYQRNYQPVHGIEIRSPQGKLRFGSMLTEEEKAWLVADLKRVVFGKTTLSGAPATTHTSITSGSLDYFSIPLPIAPGRWLGAGLMLLVIGVAFILVGLFVIDAGSTDSRRSSSGFEVLVGNFRVLWIISSSLFALAGIAMLARYAQTRHLKTHLEGTKDHIALRTTKAGRIVQQDVFPRAEAVDIRASPLGTLNGRTMKRIELLVRQNAHTLSRWTDGEKADAFVAEVRQALAKAKPEFTGTQQG